MTRTNCLFITIYRINLLKQMTKERMETFKIIGVRPLKGCNKHVIKNLRPDVLAQ